MQTRVESVDILRGLTIVAMILVNNPGTWAHIYAPLEHAAWHGLTPTDLIFPSFIFIVGISISFAYKAKKLNATSYKKITIRSLKLIALGLFLNWFLPYFPFFKSFETLRFPGVLQRIGIVFFFSALLFLRFQWKTLLIIAFSTLLIYWLFLGFVPLPDGSLPTFDRAPNNWTCYLDKLILGKHTWKSDYDPEGFLSTIPAIVTCIFGILIGKLLTSSKQNKVTLLATFGIILSVLGLALHPWFPINKAIWSSSFVLITAGITTLILTIVYYFTDVKKIKFGTLFKYVGMNAITIFFLSSFTSKIFSLLKIGGNSIHGTLYKSIYVSSAISDKTSSLLYALSVVVYYVLLGYFLYKKRIFIKV